MLEGRLYTGGEEGEGALIEPQHEVTFVIGEGDVSRVILGAELALRVMYVGQRSVVRMHPKFGFLPDERPGEVTEHARLEYKVALLSVGERPKNPAEMSPAERIAMVDQNNQKGNAEYKEGRLTRAVRFYRKGLEFVKYVHAPKADQENEAGPLSEEAKAEKLALVAAKVRCGTNLCVALAGLEKYGSAEEMCDMVLEVDPRNVKALYQKGKAVCRRKDYEEARGFFSRALQASPGHEDPAVLRELQTVDVVLREKEAQRKAMYNRMMGAPKKQAEVAVPSPTSTVEIEDITEEQGEGAPAGTAQDKMPLKEGGSAGTGVSAMDKASEVADSNFPMPKPGRRKARSNQDLAVLLGTIAAMLLLIWWAIRPRDGEREL